MDTYYLVNRFGELALYNLKKLNVEIINKLGIAQNIGDMQVIIDENVNKIGHNTADIERIKSYLSGIDPAQASVITNEQIDELLNT